MSNERNPSDISSPGGIFSGISNQVKLIIRLMADRRINPLIKILPLGSLIYLVTPDLAPGPIDDALVIWLGTTLFVELCPPEIVKEHQDIINRTIPGTWRDKDTHDVIDAEYRDLD
jgi:hypothetical protein